MITDLRLQNFRSYRDASFELSGGVNIIVGPNASGKTNLLEAVLVLAQGSSYRANDNELISFNQPWARLDADMSEGGHRTIKLINNQKPAKSYELDGKPYQRLSQAHALPTVLFEPDHLRLLSGSPERRRDYLDGLLEQTVAGYSTTRRQYKRALAQRNSLLKQSGSIDVQLFPWNVRLSQLAGQVVRNRTKLTESINNQLPDLYQELSRSSTHVTVSYENRWQADNYETALLKKLESSLEADRLRGFTGHGPHREDMVVMFDGRPAQESASRGEIRTAVLALKIIELKILAAARDVTPMLLLDDVFSELDGKRRHALTDYLAPYQTFITTTDADLVVEYFTEKCNVIPTT